jgi:CMP/dCMP kinase
MIIAIDGPSGAGKSTLGKMLAAKLHLLYLDTGAMYRAVGLAVRGAGVDFEQTGEITSIAGRADINLKGGPDSLRIFLDGRDVTDEIRTPEAGHAASVISTIPEVRKILVEHQKQIGNACLGGCVLEGRDIGTVVFPNADIKFFLTAKPEARALRRYQEDLARGSAASYEQTLAEINLRDRRDVTRADSPLSIAENSVVIDTSELDLTEVFEQMLSVVRDRSTKTAHGLT